MLIKEKEVLGFYVSSHPLDQWKQRIESFGTINTATIKERKQEQAGVLGALVKSVRIVNTRKGDRMAIVTVEDDMGVLDAVLFPRTYAECGEYLTTDSVVFLDGVIDFSRGDPQLIVEKIIPIERAVEEMTEEFKILIDTSDPNHSSSELMMQLRGVLASGGIHSGGRRGVIVSPTLVLRIDQQRIGLRSDMRIRPSESLIADIEQVASKGCVKLKGRKPTAASRNNQRRFAKSG